MDRGITKYNLNKNYYKTSYKSEKYNNYRNYNSDPNEEGYLDDMGSMGYLN